jgi:hypothetical protein
MIRRTSFWTWIGTGLLLYLCLAAAVIWVGLGTRNSPVLAHQALIVLVLSAGIIVSWAFLLRDLYREKVPFKWTILLLALLPLRYPFYEAISIAALYVKPRSDFLFDSLGSLAEFIAVFPSTCLLGLAILTAVIVEGLAFTKSRNGGAKAKN